MHVELDWRELIDSPAPSISREAPITAPRGLTPPRLHAVDAAVAPVSPRAAADVWLSVEVVNQRAEAEAAAARATGAPHTLRLWREGHERALLALARDAAGAPANARCEAIAWEQVGNRYHVSASFTSAPIH